MKTRRITKRFPSVEKSFQKAKDFRVSSTDLWHPCSPSRKCRHNNAEVLSLIDDVEAPDKASIFGEQQFLPDYQFLEQSSDQLPIFVWDRLQDFHHGLVACLQRK